MYSIVGHRTRNDKDSKVLVIKIKGKQWEFRWSFNGILENLSIIEIKKRYQSLFYLFKHEIVCWELGCTYFKSFVNYWKQTIIINDWYKKKLKNPSNSIQFNSNSCRIRFQGIAFISNQRWMNLYSSLSNWSVFFFNRIFFSKCHSITIQTLV